MEVSQTGQTFIKEYCCEVVLCLSGSVYHIAMAGNTFKVANGYSIIIVHLYYNFFCSFSLNINLPMSTTNHSHVPCVINLFIIMNNKYNTIYQYTYSIECNVILMYTYFTCKLNVCVQQIVIVTFILIIRSRNKAISDDNNVKFCI